MEAASLDITKAYWNLPILPRHKKYLPILWLDPVFVQHVAIEGLVTTGGIQGTIADALGILDFHGIRPTIKWVDDFIFFRELTYLLGCPQFHYNLSDILVLTKPLGIPWHSISKKGQDFTFHFNCVRFHWDISTKCVPVPHGKQLCAIGKVVAILTTETLSTWDILSVLSTLQHLTFVYRT